MFQDLVSSEANKEHREVDANQQVDNGTTATALNYKLYVEAILEFFLK